MSTLGLLTSGQTIGSYEVVDLLGSGGMANVYRVRHRVLGTEHALKLLTLTSRSIQARLINEGRIQAHLRHPNVVAVTDSVDLDGSPGLVMELVEGPDLDELLQAVSLDLAQLHALGQGILEGIRAAHASGSIHRDLKPANVLVAEEGGRWVPKVADFGLAKVLDGDASLSRTRSGTTMGTPAYMSPEQIQSTKDTDERTDVWAAGCILFEMVTGRSAFLGDEPFAVMQSIVIGPPPDPHDVRPDLPEPLADAIRSALVLERTARCGSIAELSERWSRWEPEASPRWPTLPARHTTGAADPTDDTYAMSADPAPQRTMASTLAEAPADPPPASVAAEPSTPRRGPGVGGLIVGLSAVLLLGLVGVGIMTPAAMPEAPREARETPSKPPAPPPPAPGPATPEPIPAAVITPAAAPKAAPAVAPAPAPFPATPAPAPAPAPAPTPEPEPEPAAPPPRATAALVTVEGDGDGLLLRSSTGDFPPAEAPPGTYRMTLLLGDQAVDVGELRLVEGTTAQVRCSTSSKRCVVR